MNKKKVYKKLLRFFILIAILIFILIFILILIRLAGSRELDDLHPDISCSEDLIEKSDVLWVIPKLNNNSITENPEWCKKILNLNKTLGLHGIYHNFEEFDTNRNQEYLQEGIEIFEKCFGYVPEKFKPPQLKISKINEKIIKNNNLKLKGKLNQVIHKVYHCDNSGPISNKFIDLF